MLREMFEHTKRFMAAQNSSELWKKYVHMSRPPANAHSWSDVDLHELKMENTRVD
jgi:hypothetical protein